MKKDEEIARQFKKHLKITNAGLSKQYSEVRACQEFYAGDLMDYSDRVQFTDPYGNKKRAMVQFNKVKPYVNAVKGFMAQNRRKAKYVARLPSEQAMKMYSQYSNALGDYVRDIANADQVETQQDGDMLVGGYGAVETAMTYGVGQSTTDPNGQVLIGRLDPLQVGWDPYAKETNLLDSRWCMFKKDYDLEEAMELFDDNWEDDFEGDQQEDLGEDDGYRFYARGGRYNKIREAAADWSDQQLNLVKVYFYQWYELETFYRAENPIYALTNPQAVQLAAMQLDAIAQELTEDQKDLFQFDPRAEILTFDEEIKGKLVEAFGKFIQVFDYKRKVYYSAVLSGEHVFTAYRSACQQGFTIKFKTGDYDAKKKIWTGMVTSMRDPVLYYNKALTELMFIIGVNSKGGVMVERSAVDDISEFEAKYAKTDAAVIVNDGALSGMKIQPKRQPYTPSGYENIIQLSDASISDVNGIDRAFLGSSENKLETGILQKRRIKQVVSALACYFDAITLYQKEHARLMLDFLRIYVQNNAGGMFRILGKNGREEYLKISEDKLCAQYDVQIVEAPQSDEEKQEFAQILTGIGDKLLAVDPASAKFFYAVSLKYLPLEQDDVQEITQRLMPQQQQIDPQYVQQLEQQIKSLMSDVTQADVKKKLSEVALNTAQLDEIAANVHAKLAQANKTQNDAVKSGIEASFMQNNPQSTTAVI